MRDLFTSWLWLVRDVLAIIGMFAIFGALVAWVMATIGRQLDRADRDAER